MFVPIQKYSLWLLGDHTIGHVHPSHLFRDYKYKVAVREHGCCSSAVECRLDERKGNPFMCQHHLTKERHYKSNT